MGLKVKHSETKTRIAECVKCEGIAGVVPLRLKSNGHRHPNQYQYYCTSCAPNIPGLLKEEAPVRFKG